MISHLIEKEKKCFNQTLNKYMTHENKLREKYKPQRLLRKCKSSTLTIVVNGITWPTHTWPTPQENVYSKNSYIYPKKASQFLNEKITPKISYLPNKPIFKTKKLFMPFWKNQAPGPVTWPTQKKEKFLLKKLLIFTQKKFFLHSQKTFHMHSWKHFLHMPEQNFFSQTKIISYNY